ncbi:MAG: MBL fold metallo-hydrolase [Acidimicrobiia bacterium]|nr:MBL fold metallo-hydrolase [Acidimicrobiia bacterium]
MDRKPASATTAARHGALAATLPVTDADFDDATRGRIAPLPGPAMHPAWGHAVWDPKDWEFIEGDAPPSVNPSLWRQARLNAIHGLFEVAEGVYQVRGVDLSNITFIASADGWIVIDPLTASETAAFALELLHQHQAPRPVAAVIYTHSHIDHFGGVRGVIADDDVANGRVQVIAPVGFLEAAISENVVAGAVMMRRASYMYGRLLPGDELGHVDCGLGKAIPLLGTTGLIAPTVEITHTGQELEIGGVRLRFQYTPDTEAPAEMNIFLPDRRLLCMAENCSATLHNVYTPRGAQIRDALSWSKYINESIELFADATDIVFMSHHWPRFGTEVARQFMAEQRDAYRWIHDQTMRRANHGDTPLEIAETLGPPPGLGDRFHVRGYYGTLSHNAKAVYQRYLGWFDGNPAHLHPLPPVEASVRYVEFMGGADSILDRVRACIDAGEYRWAAQVLDHVVFAEPENREAHLLQADVFEQLGYGSESGPWRDFYLTGAQELRHGAARLGGSMASSIDILRAMTTEMLIDLIGVRLDGERIGAERLGINLTVTDRDERWFIGVEHGAVHGTPDRHDVAADLGVEIAHLALARLASGTTSLDDLGPADLMVTGDRSRLEWFLGLLDTFDASFAIVTAERTTP